MHYSFNIILYLLIIYHLFIMYVFIYLFIILIQYHSLLFILIPVRENPNFETHVVSCWKVHSDETMWKLRMGIRIPLRLPYFPCKLTVPVNNETISRRLH